MPTKTAGKPLPTMPPFDFEGYLREKDNRDFKLLIDQPEKCHIGGAEEKGGGESKGSTTAPYMLIAVKSIAADFDKRQVKYGMLYISHCKICCESVQTFSLYFWGIITNAYKFKAAIKIFSINNE